MPLTAELVGLQSAPVRRTWEERDAIIYALGVGAGAVDPTGCELEYTTENSLGVPQRVLPTFGTVIGASALPMSALGDIDLTRAVHGDQVITLYGRLPTSGSVDVVTSVGGIHDKGSGALVLLESTICDVESKSVLMTTTMGLFLRGAGGFGGPKRTAVDADGELASEPTPNREADQVISYSTRTDQALLYRMSGDRNPLHADPVFAKLAGFDRPILHGLCTFGFAGRALLHSLCSSDPELFGSMRARFTHPTIPGDTLTTSIWVVSDAQPGAFRFRTENQHGDVVIDSGLFRTA